MSVVVYEGKILRHMRAAELTRDYNGCYGSETVFERQNEVSRLCIPS